MHPVFWFTITQSVRLPMVTHPSLCSTCVTYRTLCHTIGHQMLPTRCSPLLPRAAPMWWLTEHCTPLIIRYIGVKHVPLPAYLTYLSPKKLHILDLFKCYIYQTMNYNASYKIWTLFAIVYCARSSILYPFGYRALWSMVD